MLSPKHCLRRDPAPAPILSVLATEEQRNFRECITLLGLCMSMHHYNLV